VGLSKQRIKSGLDKVPWLRRRLQKIVWQRRGQRSYKGRLANIPDLLQEYGVKVSKSSTPKHVIFIVVDALRKDHLSLFGYERKTTPFLDSIAESAAVFENAITASPWTFPAVASMLSGLYPHKHGGMHTGNNLRSFDIELPCKVREDVLALPEFLRTLDFESHLLAAITPVAMATGGWFKSWSVFLGGADQHLRGLLKWLGKNRAKRTFVYLQVGDLHAPINAPRPYRHTFGDITDIPKLDRWQFLKDAQPGDPDFERYRESRCKLYDCALRFVDAQIARFFAFLDEINVLDSSLIFVTADHGEEFWDHVELERKVFSDPRGFYGVSHGHNLFQELINVPLICMGPGIVPGRYCHNVSLVDLTPTVLAKCGIEYGVPLDGGNLFDSSAPRSLLSEGVGYGYEKKAVLKDKWKLLHCAGDGVNLLFNLAEDPYEKHDLSKINPQKLHELKALLPKTEKQGGVLEINRQIQEQLRNLGYM